jgi:CheY-like chemotaxis protein
MLSESVLEDPDIRAKSLIGFNLSSLERPRGSPRPLRVLVVDDSAMCRSVAASFIRSGGHEVACVESGVDAVQAVATMDFDVVMMDLRMPDMDGVEATCCIRALEAPRGRVPIVAVTSLPGEIAFFKWMGIDGYLPKPFTPDSLLEALARVATNGQLTSANSPRT